MIILLSLHAINLIKKYFTPDERKGLLVSNYYSILYSEIWHLHTLNPHLKQKLLLASVNALMLCQSPLPPHTSFKSIHRLAKRATPIQMSSYKHALQLYKLFNSNTMTSDWIDLNNQQSFNRRNETFKSSSAVTTK